MALPADSLRAAACEPGVLLVERVPELAVRLRGLSRDDSIAAEQVHSMRHRFEMLGIHAEPDAASVI
jgi:hypothetical protein